MKRRWKFLGLILFLGLVLMLLLRAFNQPTLSRRIVLADGSHVILRDLTFGTNHTFTGGNIFQRTAARVLPAKVKARFKLKELSVRVPDPQAREFDTMVAWVERTRTRAIEFRVSDEAGHEQGAERANASSLMVASNAIVSGHVFASFPRRARFVTLRAYDYRATPPQVLGEFRVRNPAYARYPKWIPEPLPIQRKTNDMSFTLTRCDTGVQSTREFASMSRGWTEIEYEYGPADFLSGPWAPIVIVLSDASGNQVRRTRPTQSLAAAVRPRSADGGSDRLRREVISVPAMLWLDEPAWSIHLELERTARSGFRTNEFWDVTDVAIPAIGRTNDVQQRTVRYGSKVVFEWLSTYEAGNRPYANPIINIQINSPSRSGTRTFLQRVTDQRGEVVKNSGFLLHPVPPESERLNFRFVIHQVIALDFRVKPRLAATNVLNPESLFQPL